MKKITLTLLILVFAVQAFAEGIHNAAELVEFANAVNSGQSMTEWRNADGEICLEADIDMSKAKKFKAKVTIEGDKLRVSSASKDTLQEVIQFVKSQDYGQPLQFVNYR